MIKESDRAKQESAEEVARRKTSPREDLHEQERQRALERYLDSEMYAELRDEQHIGPSEPTPVDKSVRARRQHEAARRMREQVAGADEVPRQARRTT
jgi:hypothetical protein